MSASLILLLLVVSAIGFTYWYTRAWKPYDPGWLIQLSVQQFPDESWLAAALERCTLAKGGGKYLYFTSPARPNQPKSAWQFEKSIILEHPDYELVCLDILKGNVIGGVELLPKGRFKNQSR